MLTNKIWPLWLWMVLFLPGCHTRQNLHPKPNTLSENKTASPGMQSDTTGPDTLEYRSGEIRCTGTLEIPISERFVIAAPAGGAVKVLSVKPGHYYPAGTVLLILESPEFIQLQQEYLETQSRLAYSRIELKRQGELAIEKATSLKIMQKAEMEYQIQETKIKGLIRQLNHFGIQPDSINTGHLLSEIVIRTPHNGYVDSIAVLQGEFVPSGKTLVAMIRNYRTEIRLQIPENRFTGLDSHQTLRFFLPGDPKHGYEARWVTAGRTTTCKNRMITAWAFPVQSSEKYIPGMQVMVLLNPIHPSGR
jgi:cobalt-zinc-cadmium efflux system membrane fusion protein